MSSHHDRSSVRRPVGSALRRAVLTGAVLALIGVRSVLAGVVGPPIPIWVEPEVSGFPAVAFSLQHEEFLVVWHNVQGPNTWDVYARRVAMDGTPRSWFAVMSAGGELHYDPVVAFNSLRDEYFVCWTADASMNAEIACTWVAWDGSSIGLPAMVVSDVGTQTWPRIVFNPHHDEYVVAYTNYWTGLASDVAVQRVAGDGTLLSWASIASGSNDRSYVDVAFNADLDEYLFLYHHASGASQYQVRGKVAPSALAGVRVAPEIDLCPFDPAWYPTASWSPEGYLTVWYAEYLSPDWLTSARHVDNAGVPQGPAGGFPISDPVGAVILQGVQDATWAPPVGHVVAFECGDPISPADICARAVSPHVERALGPQLTAAGGTPSQLKPAVACAPWGVCLVVYQEDDDIVARILRFHAFADGFDETGDTSYWSAVVP